MQVRLLGPVDVVVGSEPRPVHGLRRKAVLAMLALHGGEIVSTDLLADAVWGDAAPATAVNTLQSHVSYLRGVLGAKTAILARPPGYVMQLPDGGTDIQVAERLLEQGTRCADPAGAVAHLQGALALWRGRPLTDVADLAWLSAQAEHLDLLRMRIRQALSEARLAAGEHAQLLPELEQMVTDYPLDERIHGQLILALYRSGRQADALAVYHRLRQRLGEELGIDPSPALRDLETAILQQDPSLDAPMQGAQLAAPVAPVPAQLPPAVPAFTGRGAELASLDAIAVGAALAGRTAPAAVVISAVSGTAGVGKTALAVHWAHRVAGQFPGGQLYVNLRGFDPSGDAMDPGQALRGFLAAFGVPATRIPDDLAAQTGVFRSLLAGKRVLVVLDNARSAEQVRPLLPGSPGCLAIVTSRDQLAGLVATEGARPLALDLLTTADARDLLTRRLGANRIAAEPEAADCIIGACARLPLALTIAAARAAISPSFPLAAIAAELHEATSALDAFDGGDSATDVRAVFSWSYRTLSTPAARIFRLLGLHPGPDIAVAAAASLTAVPPGQARALLAELSRAHLLAEQAPGRYACHDLLRTYASELAHTHDDQGAQDTAVGRVLDHYLHTASNAVALVGDAYQSAPLDRPRPGVIVGEPAAADDALRWLDDECATLLAAVRLAADMGLDAHCWQLAWTLITFLGRQGLWQEQVTALRTGLAAARRSSDTAGQAHILLGLGRGYARARQLHEADQHLRESQRLFDAIGGHFNLRANLHSGLAWLAEQWRRHDDTLRHSLRALELYRAGNQRVQILALNNVGYAHALLGDYDQALSCCERALAAGQEFEEHDWVKATLHSLGFIHHRLGDHRQAIAYYERSLELCRQLGDRYDEAEFLVHVGDVYDSAGDRAAARREWTRALRIHDEIGHPGRDLLRARLRVQDHTAANGRP